MASPVDKLVLALALLLARTPAHAADGSNVQEEEYEETDQQGEVTQGSQNKQQQADDADEDEDSDGDDDAQASAAQAKQADRMRIASSTMVRRFHEVLDELLAEFGYDVKMGQIKGLANLAIRKVRVSNAIPRTYEDYVDMLLTERIRENSRVKLIACVPCKTRTSSLEGGRLIVTSPATNLARLEAAAATLGIENFMDAVLVYHTTHMVLAVSVFNAQTKELVWARTYNSETVKSRYQKLAIDYSQVKKTEPGEDYSPEYRFMFGLGGASMPNVGGDSKDRSMMSAQVRATEKFNNRRTEFGMMLSVLKTAGSLVKEYPTEKPAGSDTQPQPDTPPTDPDAEPKPKPFETAVGIYGVYGHVFLGAVESYNEVRHGFHVGAGIVAAAGFIAPTLRLGYDMFFGRRFVTSFTPSYVAASSVLVDGETVKTKGGAGFDVIMSLNY